MPTDGTTIQVDPVPPSSGLVAELHALFISRLNSGQIPPGTTFDDFFAMWSCERRGPDDVGLDDRLPTLADAGERIDRPRKVLKGVIKTLVLLVDFADRPNSGQRPSSVYEPMLSARRARS